MTINRLCYYALSSLSGLLLACTSLKSLDAVYFVNPVAAETPVYRQDDPIIINFALLPNTLALARLPGRFAGYHSGRRTGVRQSESRPTLPGPGAPPEVYHAA